MACGPQESDRFWPAGPLLANYLQDGRRRISTLVRGRPGPLKVILVESWLLYLGAVRIRPAQLGPTGCVEGISGAFCAGGSRENKIRCSTTEPVLGSWQAAGHEAEKPWRNRPRNRGAG